MVSRLIYSSIQSLYMPSIRSIRSIRSMPMRCVSASSSCSSSGTCKYFCKTHDQSLREGRLFYNLMKLLDTSHDFFKSEEDFVRCLPHLPKELPLAKIMNENVLCQTLATCDTLTFGNTLVKNPLYGAHLYPSIDIRSYQHSRHSIETIEVPLSRQHPEYHSQIERLHRQVCLSKTRPKIGPTVFQVDATNNPLMTLLQTIDNSITATISDANMFDATTTKHSVRCTDVRPTGCIYLPEFENCYQIELLGISYENNTGRTVGVKMTDYRREFESTFTLTDGAAAKCCSKRSIQLSVANHACCTTCPVPRTSELRHAIHSFSRKLKFAIKRAGDWSQVEHAARYGKVFVTNDRLAALYAWYREVPCVFMRRTDTTWNFVLCSL